MSDEAVKIIDVLNIRFGPLGGQIWEIYIKQAVTAGIVMLLLTFICLLVMWATYRTMLYARELQKEAMTLKNPASKMVLPFFLNIVSGGIWLVAFFIGVISLINGTQQLLNPEYYALKELLTLVYTR